jgi:hypothetical protein
MCEELRAKFFCGKTIDTGNPARYVRFMLKHIKAFLARRSRLALCRSHYHFAKTSIGKWQAIHASARGEANGVLSHVEICEHCKCGYIIISE